MSDFLTNVLARSTGRARTIQPRLLSRFESLQSIPEEIPQETFGQSTSSLVSSSSQPSDPPPPQSAQRQSKSILRSASEPTDQASNSNSAVDYESSDLLIQVSRNVARSSSTAPLDSAQANPELHRLHKKEKDSLSAQSPMVVRTSKSHKTEVRSPVLRPQITRIQEPASFPNLPTPQEPTVIKVIIGRVEIRATTAPTATSSSRLFYQSPQPDLSLKNYLKSRSGGGV